MRLKARHDIILLLLLFFPAFGIAEGEHQPRLFKRYDPGGAYNRVAEDILTLSLSVGAKDRAQVAVRVCSKEPLPFALANAGADPFHIADLLTGGYGYTAERVIFLRAEDCVSAKDPSRSATEVWAIPEGASLPFHVEALQSNQVKLMPLGKRTANRGVRDYRSAVDDLIKTLKANSTSRGVIFGYFLERPSLALQRRLREVKRILAQSGLPRDHYLVRPMPWNDEVSTYPRDSEPQYPTVFLVELTGSDKPK